MTKVKLKVCGMKWNTAEVAELQPDYLGFIFYEGSQRNFSGEIPKLPSGIKKVGVFVNASIEEVSEKIKKYKLDVIQLHGEETPEYCQNLIRGSQTEPVEVPLRNPISIWKVFSIKDSFDFKVLKPYELVVDKFLFDTKGKEKGGNGYTFNWNILKDYPSEKPFILSGGIGLTEIDSVKKILKTKLPIYAIDVNSMFEIEPGLKDIDDLKKFNSLLCDER